MTPRGPVLLLVLATCLLTTPGRAQDLPPFAANAQMLQVLGVSVEGVEDEYTRGFVLQTSGLSVGQRVQVPGDPAFADAIRSVYRLGAYDDVQIIEDRRVGDGVFLTIRVTDVPKLAAYEFEGVKKGEAKDLRKEVPLLLRSPVRPSAIARTEQVVKEFFAEKGRPLADVDVEKTRNADNTLDLLFRVDKGPKVKVSEIVIDGNEQLSDGDVRGAMDTKTRSWWRFWRKATFKERTFEEDLQKIVEKYNEKGYFDATVVRDSVWIENPPDGDPSMVVAVEVHEGPRYYVRDVTWEGNALYTDEQLTEALGFRPGDPYNGKRLESNLYGSGKDTDIYSLYFNRGHMRFNATPRIEVVAGDSLNLHFDVFEGDVYRYGTITVAGNSKTKEHVVRRELETIPGQTFSRDGIQSSIRRLMQLNYFTQESLAVGPAVAVQEESKTVDLAYNLEETGSDQLELSGTWGRYGMILQLRFSFNNFSAQNLFKRNAWRPLPSGDGQRLSLAVQTNGRYYQQYSLSFTEPWFRGRPTPVGFSASFSKISGSSFLTSLGGRGDLLTFSTNVFYEQRLSWPDPWFSTSSGIGFQYFDNDDWITTLPSGVSRQVTFRQSLTRNSTNHPIFPSDGSKFLLSLEVAPPIGDLIQFHKWRFTTSWNAPLSRRISLGVTTDYGYIGSLTGEDVAFERFLVGGSPFETQGYYSYFGKDVVYMRGYPLAALGPRRGGEPVGGRVLNRYTSELRWMAITEEQLQAQPYLFLDAANAWDGFSSYNPTDLFRSAGFGTRLFLPILGMVELTYGYNFDAFTPINSRHPGTRKWSFQFSLGQGFGQ
jgi:outer membrane protein insertion porin family